MTTTIVSVAETVQPSPSAVKTPTKILGKNHAPRTPAAHVRGFSDFALIAQEKLSRYDLPDSRTRVSVEGLRGWLPQLELTERRYARLVGMSLEKSVKWNAHWPLVSWLGVVLEMKADAELCGR